jgi:hypothetical protein
MMVAMITPINRDDAMTTTTDDTYGLGALRAKFGAHDISIGRDFEGYKVYIDDRYEALKPSLPMAKKFVDDALSGKIRKSSLVPVDEDFLDEFNVLRLAHEFGAQVGRDIGTANMASLRAWNEKETNPNICHSHDYCDANEAMQAAFKMLFQRAAPIAPADDSPASQAAFEADYKLQTEAWKIAKACEFRESGTSRLWIAGKVQEGCFSLHEAIERAHLWSLANRVGTKIEVISVFGRKAHEVMCSIGEDSLLSKEKVVFAAGYTLGHTAIGGWYALLPGETEFKQGQGDDESQNYLGFFSTRNEMLEEIAESVETAAREFNELSESEWANAPEHDRLNMIRFWAKEAIVVHEQQHAEAPTP